MAGAIQVLRDAAEFRCAWFGFFEQSHTIFEDTETSRILTDARWTRKNAEAWQPTICKVVDPAMAAIGRDNSTLIMGLFDHLTRRFLDKLRLGPLDHNNHGDGGGRSLNGMYQKDDGERLGVGFTEKLV